jgi:non-specific protein-tyrosine kinase
LWLILVVAFVAGGCGFIYRSTQPSVYTAETTIAIGGFIESPNPDSAEIRTGLDLAQTYAELVTTYSVLQATVDKLKLDLSAEELGRIVSTRIITGTSLLVVRVPYTDPVLAADIANELAQQLILNSPTNLTPEQQNQIDLANEQIERLNQQVEQARLQLEQIDLQLVTLTDQKEVVSLNAQRNALINQTNQASATIAQFSDTIAKLQQRTNSLDIVELARIPTTPSGSDVLTTTIAGALFGAFLASGAVVIREHLNDTIRTTEEAAQTLALPVLGAIVRYGKSKDSYQQRLITQLALMVSPVSEGYRAIRTNLLFSSDYEHKKVYLVTSAGPSEGKSVTTSNLAVSMALAGMRVLLIDADLRRPKVHEIFGLNNDFGMTTLLFASQSEKMVAVNGNQIQIPDRMTECLQETHVPKLRVITSGFIPENPVEILGSILMKRWIENLRSSNNVDIVLIDTPPCLTLSDSVVLAANTDAEVILVIDAGRTRRDAARKAREQFSNIDITIKGVVVNRVNPKDEAYYGYGYGYGYYGYYSRTPNLRQIQQSHDQPESYDGADRNDLNVRR